MTYNTEQISDIASVAGTIARSPDSLPPRLRHDLACVTVLAGMLAPQSAETLPLSSSAGDVRPWLEQAVVGPQPQQDHRELAGHGRALAAEARLARLRPQPFRSEVAF